MVSAAPTMPYRHGRYILLQEIGRGGMAVVYRAKYVGEEGVARDIAVKRMLPEWSVNADFVRMLVDEARVLTRLQHPNIVQVHELGVDEGNYFLAMEYVAGFDLATMVTQLRQGQLQLSEPFAYFIIQELLQGLHFAHSQVSPAGDPLGVVHRDISPHNILVSLQGEVKIADFGIAKGAHRQVHTTVAQVKGKYAYMAPEQATGELRIDRRADIFSAGILLYELVSGTPLFDAPNDMAVIGRVRDCRMPAGWERLFHPAVRNMLRRALAGDLAERYPTAAAFYADLSQFVTQHALTTTRVAFAEFLQSVFPAEWWKQQHTDETALPEMANLHAVYQRQTRVDPATKRPWTQRMRTLHLALLATSSAVSMGAIFPGDMARREPQWVVRTIPALAVPVIAAGIPPVASPEVLPVPPAASMKAAITTAAALASSPAPATPAKGRISVNARPWGYVQIPGLLARRETPVSISAEPGAYTVRVSAGNGKSVAARAVVRPGKTATCQAVLGDEARLSCH